MNSDVLRVTLYPPMKERQDMRAFLGTDHGEESIGVGLWLESELPPRLSYLPWVYLLA